ncbi:hypothetical protein K1W54_33270 [Micromonospora sp. CPCC 205371]|nr:hypothetical protein [Micromonospora sp. CPCC 205371]
MMKSGTHLITELLRSLGYRLHGHVRVRPETRPLFDTDTRWRMAEAVYDDDRLTQLKSDDEATFETATDEAFDAIAWAWKLRLGMPLERFYSTELVNTDLVRRAVRRTAGSAFAETPPGICWVLHDFDIRTIDGAFLREWTETGEPRIIFNYRDPRDITLSMVNFLCERTRGGLSSLNNLGAFSTILRAKKSLDEQLSYALADESFPSPGDQFKRMLWLLHHPAVYKASYEELVGPQGGGSAESQLRATAGLVDFLGCAPEGSVEDIARSLYNPDAFTFFKGRTGAWRDVYNEEHRRLADARFGEILPMYGYT